MSKFVTASGLKKLQQQLDDLQLQEATSRKRIAETVGGDAHDNFAAEDLARELGTLQTRMRTLRLQIENAVVQQTQQPLANGVIQIGSVVTIYVDGDEEIYHIVGSGEGNPSKGTISYDSPLGIALMGKVQGSMVDVKADESYEVKVLDIK